MVMSIYKGLHQYSISTLTDATTFHAWLRKSRKEKIFYVYIKMRPCGRPFHVGKGFGYRAFSKGGRNQFYKNITNKYGYEFIKTTIIPVESEAKAFSEEIRLTAYFKVLGCKLSNMTSGGEGVSGLVSWSKGKKLGPASPEHIEKRAKGHLGIEPWNKGKSLSLAHRKGISIGKLGKSSSLKGTKRPVEVGEKISKSKKGKSPRGTGWKHTPETRLQQSLSSTGKVMSQEACQRMSSSHTGVKLSIEHCEALRLSKIGKPLSESHRINIGLSRKGKPLNDAAKLNMSKSKKAFYLKKKFRQLAVKVA